MRAVAIALLFLPLAGAAGWDQTGADAENTGQIDIADGPRDVVSVFRWHDSEWRAHGPAHTPFVPWGDGLVAVLGNAELDECLVSRLVDWRTQEVREQPVADCGLAQTHVAVAEINAVIFTGSGGFAPGSCPIRAIDVDTGERVWEVALEDLSLGHYRTNAPGGEPCSGSSELVFATFMPSIHDGVFYAPMWATHTSGDWMINRLAAVDARTGDVLWHDVVPSAVPVLGAADQGWPAVVPTDSVLMDGLGLHVAPFGATVLGDRMLISSFSVCAAMACDRPTGDPDERPRTITPAFTWMNLATREWSGGWAGFMPDLTGDPSRDQQRDGIRFARGPTAIGGEWFAFVRGGFVAINPDHPSTTFRESPSPEGDFFGRLSSRLAATDGATVFVARYQTLNALRPGAWTQVWDSPVSPAFDDKTWWSPAPFVGAQTELFATWEDAPDDGRVTPHGDDWLHGGLLTRHDRTEGTVRQALPLPLTDPAWSYPVALNRWPDSAGDAPDDLFRIQSGIQTVPLPGNIMAHATGEGTVAITGAATGQGPRFTVSSLRPVIGEAVTIAIDTEERAVISWGDGETANLPAGGAALATHAYQVGRPFEALVTVVHDDGTTDTQSKTIDVGGDPPPGLLRQAFSRYVDNTWGILGIAIAGGGAAVGLYLQRRRRVRVSGGLSEIDAARALGGKDALAGLRRASSLKRRFDDGLMDGTWTEDQHRLLVDRTRALRHRLARLLLLEPLEGAPRRFDALVWTIFEDDAITAAEEKALMRQGKRSLSRSDLALLHDVVAAWRGDGPSP